jgi:uncharacterized membrane protein
MDAQTPAATPAEGRPDVPDETGGAPDQPTVIDPRHTAEASGAVGDEDGTVEHDAMTQADLPRAQGGSADYGPRRVERRPARISGSMGRPSLGQAPRPSGGPPRMPRGWQPLAPQSGVPPRAYRTPRVAQPSFVPWEASSAWGPTTFTITANTAAGFSYLFWWVSGLLVYFNERRNRFVRFNAVQSIILTSVLSIFCVLVYIIAALLNDVFLTTHQHIWLTLSQGTVALAIVLVALPWLTAMIAAWSGTYLRLPIVGDYAERYASPPFEPRPRPPER